MAFVNAIGKVVQQPKKKVKMLFEKINKWVNGVWLAIRGKQQFYTDTETPYKNPSYGEAN